MNIHPRMSEVTINTGINAYNMTNVELYNAIAEEIDLETVTSRTDGDFL
jgi:hypothetical protein